MKAYKTYGLSGEQESRDVEVLADQYLIWLLFELSLNRPDKVTTERQIDKSGLFKTIEVDNELEQNYYDMNVINLFENYYILKCFKELTTHNKHKLFKFTISKALSK